MKLEALFGCYKSQYNLPIIQTRYNLKDSNAYQYCSRKKYFSIVIPFDAEKNIIVEHLISDYSKFGWTLIGGSVHENDEDFIDGAYNNVLKILGGGIRLEEFQPIAILINEFKYGDKIFIHYGVAFISKINNTVELDEIIKKSTCSRIPVFGIEDITNIHNKKVLDIARDVIGKYSGNPYHSKEISYSYRFEYQQHQAKNIELQQKEERLNPPCKLVDFSEEIAKKIIKYPYRRFLDIACGENDLGYKIARKEKCECVYLNDIAWNYIRNIHKIEFTKKKYRRERAKIVFTNHDALDTPFVDGYFDVVLAKNLLHHLYSFDNCERFIREVRRISKYLFLIEISHPEEQSVSGKELHKEYYCDVLKEDEECYYIKKHDFEALTNLSMIRSRESWQMETIKGVYNLSILEF